MSEIETEIARRAASGSSFYWGMRLLPPERREGMYAIYSFCRAVDDVADDVRTSDLARMADLRSWRDCIAALFRNQPTGKTAFLEPAVRRFGLREEDFLAVIEGMEMDAQGAMLAPVTSGSSQLRTRY